MSNSNPVVSHLKERSCMIVALPMTNDGESQEYAGEKVEVELKGLHHEHTLRRRDEVRCITMNYIKVDGKQSLTPMHKIGVEDKSVDVLSLQLLLLLLPLDNLPVSIGII